MRSGNMRWCTIILLVMVGLLSKQLFVSGQQVLTADAGATATATAVTETILDEPKVSDDAATGSTVCNDDEKSTTITNNVIDDSSETMLLHDPPVTKYTNDASDAAAKPSKDNEEESSTTTSTKTANKSTAGQEAPKFVTNASTRQSGPFIDLLGPTVLSLQIVDSNKAELRPHNTNDAIRGKKVIGLYFSADWCGPCRKFTPDLVQFYKKINSRRGNKDQFEIIWVSRCRDVQSYGQYFTHMGGWYALPPEEAMGQRGSKLNDLYKVKGIPTLVLLDEDGNVITTDARNKIPQDKAGIGFPWRNPIITLYRNILPKNLRTLLKAQVTQVKQTIVTKIIAILGLHNSNKASTTVPKR